MAKPQRPRAHAVRADRIWRRNVFNSAILASTRSRAVSRRHRSDSHVARPRDLSAREAACCPFLTSTVTTHDGEVTWRISADDDPTVQAILDEFHQLPERIGDGLTGLLQRLRVVGLDVRSSAEGRTITATPND